MTRLAAVKVEVRWPGIVRRRSCPLSNLIYLLHRLQVGIYYSDTGHISTSRSVFIFLCLYRQYSRNDTILNLDSGGNGRDIVCKRVMSWFLSTLLVERSCRINSNGGNSISSPLM
jgi:hypothetical protein